jgi:SAM-dependent methyltransferase
MSMTSGSGTLYDRLRYPDHVFDYTHPARLETLGTLYGMTPASPAACRVLELGCGTGGNIIPMATASPDSTFVGIDLSVTAIAHGQSLAADLGLTNIELRHCDIMNIDADFGSFDYIIAHGVYSWVPRQVRDKIMAVFARHLAPHGIGYVSYNAHPYSHLRDVTRDMMLYHTRAITDPDQKVGQARAVMKFLSENSEEATTHGKVMRTQYERIVAMPDEVLFHDDLNPIAEAFLLHEVASHAAGHGLNYLSDADFTRGYLPRYPGAIRAMLTTFPEHELVSRDQYQDFVTGHGFRRTLLCRDSVVLQRHIAPDFATRFHLMATTEPIDASWSLSDQSPMNFRNKERSEITASEPLVKSALYCLGRAWPKAMMLPQLLAEARDLAQVPELSIAETDNFAVALSHLAASGEILFLASAPPVTTTISARPTVSALARRQAASGPGVVNLLHQRVYLNDERAQRFAQLLDGTRTHDAIAADMALILAETTSASTGSEPADTAKSQHDTTQRALRAISRLGLLIG